MFAQHSNNDHTFLELNRINFISYPFRQSHKSVWAEVEYECTRDYPEIIDLFRYKFYGGPHKGGIGFDWL